MNQINDIRPLSDTAAGRLVSSEAVADLSRQITAMPRPTHGHPGQRRGIRRSWRYPAAPMALSKRTVRTCAATVAILGGGTIALAANVLGSNGPPPGLPGAPAAVVTSVDPAISAEFKVLSPSGPAVAPLPASIRADSGIQALVSAWGVNLALARPITLSDGATAWVGPGDRAICLILYPQLYHGQVADGSCATYSQAMAGRDVSLMGVKPVEAIGMVPNGVHDVTIHEQNGSTISAPVTDNAYDQLVSHPVDAISFIGPTGQVDVPVDSYRARIRHGS